MEDKKDVSLSERIEEVLYDAMKALDEMRAKTLIFNKYRDTQRVADRISDILKEMKHGREKSLQLGDTNG